ncbi:porin family protein [Shewanella sp. 202IG2-18]|uniref:outer membrane beta-barrel protein n=1 Tax=Parashewanella hymeniacidonis TaxID=2807618 RepID=UPI0019607552|nr:outer membrane beta-barrel protein [Parashewanella hymeniacidonis]MBM7070512.1 porin family protein [Parashewanella hymeniacidonis]
MIGYDLAYQYKFNNKWGVEVGYRHSEPEGTFSALKAISSLFVGTLELDYANSIRAAAVYTHSFSDNNKFDFKLGVQRYDVKSTLKGYVPVPVIGGEEQPINTISVSDDGRGLYAGLGWRYQFDSGFALGASLDHQDMDVLNVTSLNLSLGFHF